MSQVNIQGGRITGIDVLGFATGGRVRTASGALVSLDPTPVPGTAAQTLTGASLGRLVLLNIAAGSIITMPAALGTGAKIDVIVSVTATSNSHIVKVGNATDIFQGIIAALSDAGAAMLGWEAGAADDTITMNRSTTGTALVGHWLTFCDIKAGVWAVKGQIGQSGTEATPFSATVS